MQQIRMGAVLGGRYRLDRALGRGAMGQVWEGRDLHLGRRVAVKTVAPEALTTVEERRQAQRRFEREAKAAAALDHANVATVYDANITGDVCWLVMQLVDGATLGTLLDERGILDTESAVSVAAQVCSGLATAHAAGLVHRDLKPENVMLRRDGVVKILDFGLVKLVTDAGPRLTATGEHAGNLLYASPELLSGEAVLDARSDLYSVGCLLHHMLAGGPPFAPARPTTLMHSHLKQKPPALIDAGVAVPKSLQDLLSSLMAKSRDDRPVSAGKVFEALGPFLPASRLAPVALRAFGAEDPRRPFVLPHSPYPA